jgi:hypothetical protein
MSSQPERLGDLLPAVVRDLAAAREAYYERLARYSDLVVQAVRTRDPHRIGRLIDHALILPAPPGVDPAVALVTVLAAQVDPAADRATRLGWTDHLDGGAA